MPVVNLAPMLKTLIDDLDKRIRKLEQPPALEFPASSTDPVIRRDGMVWYRTSDKKFMTQENGVVRPIGESKYYAIAYDTTTQTASNSASVYPVSCSVTAEADGVTNSNGLITFPYAGQYNVQFSLQLTNSDSQARLAMFWMRFNGNDIPWTNTQITVPSKHGSYNGSAVPAWNFMVTAAAGDTFQLYWWSGSNLVTITSTTGLTAPTRPNIPGVILSVTQTTW